MNKVYDGRFNRRTFNPWKRGRDESEPSMSGHYIMTANTFNERFDDYIYANMDVSVDAKRAALKVAPSVVRLVSITSEEPFFLATGTIIDSEDVNGTFTSTILTSASLVRCPTKIDAVPDNIQIYVYLEDGSSTVGQIHMINFHYNIAAIKIETSARLSAATLRFLDDSISIDPNEISSSRVGVASSEQFQPYAFNLCPGDTVAAIGRFTEAPYEVMVAPGKFSLDVCGLDCTELFKADCIITKCGIGGPLVNCCGEVIGVNFYDISYTPFLPINIACGCLEYFKKHGRSCQPWLGTVMANLYAASVGKLEKIIQTFPTIHKGVIVEEVLPESPAYRSGILSDDVIVECNGSSVHSFLEFWGMMSNETGKPLELMVIRTSNCDALKLKMVVDVGTPDKSNRWPVAESFDLPIDRCR